MLQSKNRSIILLALLLLAAGVFISIGYSYRSPEGGTPPTPSTDDLQTASTTVNGFGNQLRMVSLLALPEVFSQSLDQYYGAYLTPELLADWKANPSNALGRPTSSPWPEGIDIISVDADTGGTITVLGNIREVANTAEGGTEVVVIHPVALTLEKNGSVWLIREVSKGSSTTVPQTVVMVGTYLCLPHKNSEGPQTLECALGLKADDGLYYALDLSAFTGLAQDVGVGTGTRVRVGGILVPIEQISSDQWNNYPIRGIIRVTNFEAA